MQSLTSRKRYAEKTSGCGTANIELFKYHNRLKYNIKLLDCFETVVISEIYVIQELLL